MSGDKKQLTPAPNEGVMEHFEDKLFKVVDGHTGFDSLAKAADHSLCERRELALGGVSDKDITIELQRLHDYLALPGNTYYDELLKAAIQRIRYLSGKVINLESEEEASMFKRLRRRLSQSADHANRVSNMPTDINDLRHWFDGTSDKLQVSLELNNLPTYDNTNVNSNEDKEPPVEGVMTGGMNSAWIAWYRRQDKGYTFMEAVARARYLMAVKRNINIVSEKLVGGDQEPSVTNDAGRPNPAWVRWYRHSNNCLLREALTACYERINKQ